MSCRSAVILPLYALAALLVACASEPREMRAQAGIAGHAPGTADVVDGRDMRLEISLSARELYVFMNGEIVDEYPVAIGQPGHPTPTGTWTVYQIDWNPDWTPPDSDWSEDEEYTPPGHSDNPMGRVRMIFNAPYSIHGTDELGSLGQAASHGSVRMANEDIIELAPRVMEHGGEPRDQAWVDDVLAAEDEMVEIRLPDPVRIDIIE